MASTGRTPLSKLEKAKRKASRDYRKLIEKRNLTYDDIFEKRAGNKNMGRKPVSKFEQVRRAKVDFLESLLEHRAVAREDSISLPVIRVLLRDYITYRATDSAGRKGSDRVITLLKYIDKEQSKYDKAMNESCPMETYNGIGRKPMSKSEKEVHYQHKINEAQNEVQELIEAAPKSQQIYYDLRLERLEVRRLKKLVSESPGNDHLRHNLSEHERNVINLEDNYNNQLVIEKKEGASNSATLVSSLAMSVSNSDLESEGIDLHDDKLVVVTNISGHEKLDLLKDKQIELDEELKSLNDLEEILREKYLLLKKKRELQETIDIKQRQLIS
jgi:hypothetical protein